MARRIVDYTVSSEGRDKGKTYRITELPSSEAESWAMRALNVACKATGGVPPHLWASGMQGLAAIGMGAFAAADWHELEPLMREMFKCISIIPDPARPDITRPLVEDDIEEVATRLELRQEVLELHLGFFKAAVRWILTAAQSSLQQLRTAGTSSDTQTSPPQ